MESVKTGISGIIRAAASCIKSGGVVIFPTETVYGIGADATNSDAVKKIYLIKKRPPSNPLIVHVADIRMAKKFISDKIPSAALKLVKRFWPGPLTIVIKNTAGRIPSIVAAGLDTVAVRAPSHPVARALIRAVGLPIAAPSANISGRVSPTSYRHIIEDYFVKKKFSRAVLPDMAIPGGRCPRGIESTIVDVSGKTIKILRQGAIPAEKILSALKGFQVVADGKTDKDPLVARAPGMMKKHYRPRRARVYLFPSEYGIFLWLCRKAARNIRHRRFFIIATEFLKKRVRKLCGSGRGETAFVAGFGLYKNGEDLSRKLYGYLRKADAIKADVILASLVEQRGLGRAVNDRLLRASFKNFFKR